MKNLLFFAAIVAFFTACGGKQTINYPSGDTDVFTYTDNVLNVDMAQGDGSTATIAIKMTDEVSKSIEQTRAFKDWEKENGKGVAAYVVRNAKRASYEAKSKCAHPATFRLEKVGIVVDGGKLIYIYDFFAKNSFGVEDKSSAYVTVNAYDDYRTI